MKYFFHPDAETDFEEAVIYYENRQYGLGYDFSIEIYSTIRRIMGNPKAWTVLEDDIRRCLTNRFPYGIIYSEEYDRIYILAVMNLRRSPDYWKYRTECFSDLTMH